MKGLIEMHNHELDKGHHLRVSFTKSTIQDWFYTATSL
jgi:hypothetical protein